MDMEKEVSLLFPEGKQVTVKGQTYTLKPFTFGKFPKVLKLFQGLQFLDDNKKLNIEDLVMANGDKMVELAALALDEPLTFFDDVPMDEAIDIIKAVVEVNGDFFVKRLLPKVTGVTSALSQSLGALSSPALSQTGTDSAK